MMRRSWLPLTLATLVAVTAIFVINRNSPAPPAAVSSVTAATAIVESPPANRVVQATLGKGGTLPRALSEIGLPEEAISSWIDRIDGPIDPRRLSPRTGFSAVYSPAGKLLSVAIRPESDRFYHLSTDSAESGEWQARSFRTEIKTVGGHLESSVSQALSAAEQSVKLTHLFAEIFQWDVDLLIDPRPGDEVRVVYEHRVLEKAPEALPPFEGVDDQAGASAGLGRILAASYEGQRATSTAIWVEDENGGDYFAPSGHPMRKAFLKSPLNYRRVSSGFSRARRHPVTGKVRAHLGVDLAASRGTPIVATADGVISKAGWQGGLGRAVRLRHGAEYETVYGHCSKLAKGIRAGVRVKQNQVIGYVGSTGLATGPHLHYTIYRWGAAVDPLRFKSDPAPVLPAEKLPQLMAAANRWTDVLERVSVERPRLATLAGAQAPGDS